MKVSFLVTFDVKSKNIKRDCWDFYVFDTLIDSLMKDEEKQELEFANLSVREVKDNVAK